MEIFRDDEQRYFDWISANPHGYVLNARRDPHPNYLVLHLASCGHISGHAANYAPDAFTGRDFIKVCSVEIAEIKAWARSLGAQQFSGVCRDCRPLASKKVDAQNLGHTGEGEVGNRHPRAKLTQTLVYQRDPNVMRATLERAEGVCERCEQKAPFSRKSDGEPYLEVHHTVPLSQGGQDILENTEALCPNCHREAHFG